MGLLAWLRGDRRVRLGVDRVPVPLGGLSAQDALAALKQAVSQWDASAYPDIVTSSGDLMARKTHGPWVLGSGRIAPHGAWMIRFVSLNRQSVLWATVAGDGKTSFRSMRMGANAAPGTLPVNWADSTRVVESAEAIYESRRQPNWPSLFDRVLRLNPNFPGSDPASWRVLYMCIGADNSRTDLDIVVEPSTAAVRSVK